MRYSQSSMVYFNYTLEYAIEDLASKGYDGIEIWGGRPHMYRKDLDMQTEKLQDLLNSHQMTVCNFIPAQFKYPTLLCSLDEAIRRDSVLYIKSAMDNAIKLKSPSVSLCPGMLPWNQDLNKGREALQKSFKDIHAINQDYGLKILIEPAHKFETNLILTVDEGVDMIDEIGLDDFGILLDTGHCHLNGESFKEAVEKCRDMPLHIHIDDNLGDTDAHLIPGEGNIDFEPLSQVLKDRNYDGFISVEIGQKYVMEPEKACEDSLGRIRQIFN